jgi:hypothetical protein
MESRNMGWMGHVARMGEMRYTYNTLVGRPEEKRPFEKHGRRWDDNIRIGGCGLDSSGSG